ncbi:pentapeptide repeat-containing protein [Streptomyces sp. NPDC054865]
MPQSNPAPLPITPVSPRCAHTSSPQDPVTCRATRVPGHTSCLNHLTTTDRLTYLATLGPGSNINHSGTVLTPQLLAGLLNAVRDPATGLPRFGDTDFQSAVFQGDTDFQSAIFQGDARFQSAIFEGNVDFRSAIFQGLPTFSSAIFQCDADFSSAIFQGDARFQSAIFQGDVRFQSAIFQGFAAFRTATFRGDAQYEAATFQGDAGFYSATFEGDADFWTAMFKEEGRFSSATFMGDVSFESATFERAAFGRATFKGHASFRSATFERAVSFKSVVFEAYAGFESATFKGFAVFELTSFKRDAQFDSTTFVGSATFRSALFEGDAHFESATFERRVVLESATFERDASFGSANFERVASLGPLVCAGRLILSGAMFGSPVTLSFAARHLDCRRTRWSSTAEIRLRYARVDFAQAVFEYPLTIAAETDPFTPPGGRQPLAETVLAADPDASVRIASLRGVDAAHLVLSDIDLSECLFSGTVHLDQVRLEGACSFASVPSGRHWRGWFPVRFTQRRTLAEEHHWRAGQQAAVPGWNAGAPGSARVGPLQLAPVYRALRKAFEDGKHEPGAADFYYGEMEMRRHADDIPRGERSLLTAYWAMSGYGLRASRALGWLAACMLATIVLMMGFGLPQDDPKQRATGTVPAGGGKVTFAIDKPDPQNPTGNRFTGKRFEKALRVTLNSVVFRSSGQDLTTAGTYIEMTSRLTEPVLLGLAILAVRNRVKR